MAHLAIAVKAILAAPKALRAMNRSPLQDQFDVAAAQANQDTSQVSYAVCRAFVASCLGSEPSSGQVSQFMEEAIQDPAFPARAYRLLGEVRKSASNRRRAFLASILFGLSFDVLPDDERDRVDMAVERMMPEDVDLLMLVHAKKQTPPKQDPLKTQGKSNVFGLIKGRDLRLLTTDYWDGDAFKEEFLEDERFRADRAALASLDSLGCVDLGESEATVGDWRSYQLTITNLGYMVIRALEEVRPGLDISI